MDIFNSFYDFFGLELLSQSANIVDLFNNLIEIGLGLFILCFFIKSLFACILNIFNYRVID